MKENELRDKVMDRLASALDDEDTNRISVLLDVLEFLTVTQPQFTPAPCLPNIPYIPGPMYQPVFPYTTTCEQA